MSSFNDIKPPEILNEVGSIHPVSNMKSFILQLLFSLGFKIIDGPEVESEEFNFDMLNIKKTHPARQMHDTFYVDNKSSLLRVRKKIESFKDKNPLFNSELFAKNIEKIYEQI